MESVTPLRPVITLKNDTEKERGLQGSLSGLLERYPLAKWLYTETVQIEEGVLPHSHPILTLSPQTKGVDYLANPEQLLGTYIHEQMHWFCLLEDKFEAYKHASTEFRTLYPNLPTERPEGCGNSFSNYLHVQVNYLEYRGLSELLGSKKARSILEQIPHYTAIYALVLRDYERIDAVMTRHGLIPDEHPPKAKRFVEVGPKKQ